MRRTGLALFVALAANAAADAAPYTVGDYWEDNMVVTDCLSDCIVRYAAVPAGKILSVTRINCMSSTTVRRARIGIVSGNTTARDEWLPVSTNGPIFPYRFDAPGKAYGAGQRPALYIFRDVADPNQPLHCLIAGSLKDG